MAIGDYFISNEAYDDDVTFKLAQAVSEEMEMTPKCCDDCIWLKRH
jgi:hypothetical protein